MIDFIKIHVEKPKKIGGPSIAYPKFLLKKSSDLMIQGGDFYAIWIEEKGLWSKDEQDAIDMIDNELRMFVEANKDKYTELIPLYLWDSTSGMIDRWHKYCQKQLRDNYHVLDEKLIFSNTVTTREDYASKKLNYPLEPGTITAYDALMSTLYSPEEREKLEWAIGAIVSGDSKKIQKFLVLYGSAGTGKSTVLNIIQKLFEGYCSSFDAKALGSANSSFALEPFKTNPLVAIQHDGDLSRIEDNTRLNSLVSHEKMPVNEKFKSMYEMKFNAFLFMGTNKPVKITDAKSGLIRRLIDVTPSGKKLSFSEYNKAMSNIDFELGAIASHCLSVYEHNKTIYDNYAPIAMMDASNDFYNFISDMYYEFKKEDGTTLKDAWDLYKTYCDEAKVNYPMSKRVFKEELKNYFHEFHERSTDGGRIRNFYKGFLADKFDIRIGKSTEEKTKLIDFNSTESIFDEVAAEYPAQYANRGGTPVKSWDEITTKLSDIDTSKLHYVKIPENHIVIDFDIPDENGNKSFEKNLEAASKWPSTYAELSKSGAGIHLHYIYNGDITKLNRLYSEHIEVKVFTGKSSLRRMLTKCNDIPIATISSGLPLKKEKNMVNMDIVTTEKGLRTTIKKNLCKEIHPATKPSIDHIYKILEDAWNSGVHYDVSDMYPKIMAFAMNSSHQAEYCMSKVDDMHFKSKDVDVKPAVSNDDRLVFYDVEVFPNLFVVCYKFDGGEAVYRLINPTRTDITRLCQYNLVGFNCRRYDNHIMYAWMQGYTNQELYILSQRIINKDKKDEDRSCFFREAYNISYTDIYDFASAGNKMSLKKLEIEMGHITEAELIKKGYTESEIKSIKAGTHHQELGLPWDLPVPEKLWDKVAEYCCNDVVATEAAFHYLKADWTARQILADLAGMTVNDTTNTLTTRIIFGGNKTPQSDFHWRDLAEPVFDMDEEMHEFLSEACPVMMSQTHGEAGSLLPYFPGYKYEFGKNTYRDEDVGKGGYVYSEPGMYILVALLDIASMHPHSTIAECLFGVIYTRAYREIVEGRVNIKHEAWEEVNHMLCGKLTQFIQRVKDGEMSSDDLANALKTAINSVYGLTSAGFENPFKDPRNENNIVALRGALFMVDLKHAVQERGFTVAHIKTDSIKIPNATPEIIQFAMDFAQKYGYTFEHEATYEKMCLVNKSTYIAKYATSEQCEAMYGYIPKDNKKHPGQWTATGDQFKVPYVFKTLFSKEAIEFEDLCETFSVKSALYLDMNEDLEDVSGLEKELDKLEKKIKKLQKDNPGQTYPEEWDTEINTLDKQISDGHAYIFIGKVGQFCPIKDGCHGGLLMREQNGTYYAATGTTGYRWLESEMVRDMHKEADINREYFDTLVTDAVHDISEYCDFEWFRSDEPVPIPKKMPEFMNIPEDTPEELPFA